MDKKNDHDEPALAQKLEESGRGLGLLSLIVGLAAGGSVYGIGEHWIEQNNEPALAVTVLQVITSFAAGWLLLAERRDFLRPIIPAAMISLVLAGPTYWLTSHMNGGVTELSGFPLFFWFGVAGPLAAFLLAALAKASLDSGAPPKYTSLFFHGLTLPLIAVGAEIFAGLALVLLYAWAMLLKSMGVDFFQQFFDQAYFTMPFLGAIGGLAIAMIRGQQAVLGALRFIALLLARILMPIMALCSLTFIAVLAIKGAGPIFDKPYPGGMMLGLAFAGMLVFNGVYQNGEGGAPPLWLRLATLITIAAFPVYAGLAAYAFWIRIGEYGLTPPRIAGLAMNTLAFAYSIVCLAGLLSELNWRAKRWMPLVAPFNTLMAVVWVVVLVAVSSPLINVWALSAKSQEARLMSGAADADEFDFGYLRFELGEYGAAALDRLEAASGHPQAAQIRTGVKRARDATSYWEYQHPEYAVTQPVEAPENNGEDSASADSADGPMALEFNPADAPESDAESTGAEPLADNE
ncbi:MAG: DUF4153 domain-containing protein [Parvularculaceae bacterium]